MAEYSTEQNFRLAQKMLEQQGEINALKAELAEAKRVALGEAVKRVRARAQELTAQMHRFNANGHFEPGREAEAAAREAHRIAEELAALDAPQRPEEIPRLAQATESSEENADD